jgi:hypothetical protein
MGSRPAGIGALLRRWVPKTLRSRLSQRTKARVTAGGAGAVFEACARRLPRLDASVWRFRAPFDRLFRLSPRSPTQQVVYAFTRDRAILDALRRYAERL